MDEMRIRNCEFDSQSGGYVTGRILHGEVDKYRIQERKKPSRKSRWHNRILLKRKL
jgi:hypothetical protein